MSFINFVILTHDSLPSTNTEAIEQARRGAPEGTTVIAHEQTAGRGRLGRVWRSPPRAGLYMSLVLRPRLTHIARADFPMLVFAAALAVHDALLAACALSTDIKYPNDLLFDARKLCGILGETVDTSRGTAAIIGIGINLTNEAFAPDLPHATSLEAATGKRFDAELITRAVLDAFAVRYESLHKRDGSKHTLAAWCAASSFADGKPVRITLDNETFTGTTRGLESDGALRVEVGSNEIRLVRAGDVTAVRFDDKTNGKR